MSQRSMDLNNQHSELLCAKQYEDAEMIEDNLI